MLSVWDLSTGTLISQHSGHIHGLLAVDFLKTGEHYISGGGDNTVHFWAAEKSVPIAKRFGHEKTVRTVAVSPKTGAILTADGRGHMKLWDPESFKELSSFGTGAEAVISAAFSPDGTMIASANRDGAVRLWRAKDQELLVTLVPSAFMAADQINPL